MRCFFASFVRREFIRRAVRLPLLVILAVVVPALTARSSSAQLNCGVPTAIVCSATGDQIAPQMVSDGSGGAIIAWVDGRDGASHIYVQHVQAMLTMDPAWPPGGLVVCNAPGNRANLRMIADGAGGAIMTWDDDHAGSFDIYAHHVLASGAVDARWPANGLAVTAAAGDQRLPSIDSDGQAGAIVAWQDDFDGLSHVQRVLESGVVDGTWPSGGVPLANPGPPHVVADGQGGAIIACASGWPSPPEHVLATGVLDPAWQTDAFETPGIVAAVSDGAGGAYVMISGGMTAYACHLFASGSITRIYSRWMRSVGAGTPVVVADRGGCAVGAYWVPPPDSPMGFAQQGIFVSLFRPSATSPAWDLWASHPPPRPRILTSEPAIAPDAAGGALVVWTDERDPAHPDIYLQHVLNSGEADPTCPAYGRSLTACTNAASRAPQIVADGAGGGIVVWQGRGDDRSWDIYAAFILGDTPTKALASLVSADATAERVRLEWYCENTAGLSATIYRCTETSVWRPVGTASPDGTGRLTFVDRDVVEGERYGYRLGIFEGGLEAFHGEAWLEIPMRPGLALQGLRPNPAAANPRVAFSLPDDGPARLAVLDVNGRRVIEKPLGSLSRGPHVVDFGGSPSLPAGLYFIQLTYGVHTLTVRGAIVR